MGLLLQAIINLVCNIELDREVKVIPYVKSPATIIPDGFFQRGLISSEIQGCLFKVLTQKFLAPADFGESTWSLPGRVMCYQNTYKTVDNVPAFKGINI